MASWILFFALLGASLGRASETVFSVFDDVFAFPQYEVVFLDSYIPLEAANAQLERMNMIHSGNVDETQLDKWAVEEFSSDVEGGPMWDTFERLIKSDRPYHCRIPRVEKKVQNTTETKPSESEQEQELARATNRGWELLQDMEGKPCLFYTTGWWSYSFCYNRQVKQFHSLPPGQNGAPLWPPVEDPTTPTYVLGTAEIDPPARVEDGSSDDGMRDVVQIQRKAETSYMVQNFQGGTPCDLTGKDRKIEIQFHCNPQTTDRIGWVKETATCAYLMVIYTPRLCNDVAFLPPRESIPHPITCEEILTPDEVEDWNSRKVNEASRILIDDGLAQPKIVVGEVEVGAMKEVGLPGKRLERGRVVLTKEERAETVAQKKDGRVEALSRADLKKLNLNPEEVEAFTNELKKLAGSKDWKIQRFDEPDGQIQLKGVVSNDAEDSKDDGKATSDDDQEGDDGSEEEYKEEL